MAGCAAHYATDCPLVKDAYEAYCPSGHSDPCNDPLSKDAFEGKQCHLRTDDELCLDGMGCTAPSACCMDAPNNSRRVRPWNEVAVCAATHLQTQQQAESQLAAGAPGAAEGMECTPYDYVHNGTTYHVTRIYDPDQGHCDIADIST